MRCQFCGWDNPQGKETCEKCNKPLGSHVSEGVKPVDAQHGNHDRPTDRQVAGAFNPRATIRETPGGEKLGASEPKLCPECGYPLENNECSACGYHVVEDFQQASAKVGGDLRKTTRPVRKGTIGGTAVAEFKLIPISEKTGMPEGDELAFEGNEVVLNRANTAPNNTTITSQEQARISFMDGVWSIEDRSEYKTTFVQPSCKVELHQGDLILFGNQLYCFEIK